MAKLTSLHEAISQFVSDGCSVAMGLQLEQMIPFAAGHEIMRQKKRGLTLIGPISDILFDQLIGAGCVDTVIAAWVGNVMMGSGYNFRRADAEGNAHGWANFGVMIEGVRSAKKVIVLAEEIVAPEIIASDPNRTIIPGFLVSAVVESPLGAHPSPVQGYYKRDDAFFQQYHEQSKTPADFAQWAQRWVYGIAHRNDYLRLLGAERVAALRTKQHAYAAAADFGY